MAASRLMCVGASQDSRDSRIVNPTALEVFQIQPGPDVLGVRQ